MNSNMKAIRIAAKQIGTKLSPYYFARKSELHDRIGVLINSLKPKTTSVSLVRVGDKRDGGYLIPDDLSGIEYCFSPGVSNLVSFERQLYDAYKIRSFVCDYAVAKPKVDFELTFDKKCLGSYNDDLFFTLDEWCSNYLEADYERDMILQMDIEGGEYPALLSTSPDLLRRFRIIIVEFHHLFKLVDYVCFPMIQSTFQRLLTTHVVVHIHPNNNQGAIKIADMVIPDVMEFTFLRKDRALHSTPAGQFPHPLDIDVDPSRKPLVLPKCWY